MNRWLRLALVLGFGLALAAFQASPPVVRAVLYYSPTCPHCQNVMTQILPPIMSQYGDQLEILGIDVTQSGGDRLYRAAIETLGIPDDRIGVPTLIVGSTVLVGDYEIPDQFPGLIETGLAQGGVDWPAIPELLAALPAETAPPVETSAAAQPWRIFSVDPLGGALAVVVLLAGLAVAAWAVVHTLRARRTMESPADGHPTSMAASARRWLPVLAFGGALISLYLTYIETSGGQAFCGPIGDCNAVQQSPYARLFGVLPIGVLGVLGYSAILWLHFHRTERAGRPADRASLALLGLTLAGALFSAYLTFLEAFVIQAVCTWCLASAVLMTALLGLTVKDAAASLARLVPRAQAV